MDSSTQMISLFNACRNGKVDDIKGLLACGGSGNGLDVNQCAPLEGGYKQPPLFVAALNGHRAVVELLVECNADVGVLDSEGENVFGFLGRYGQDEMAQFVHQLKHRAPPTPGASSSSQLSWQQLLAQAIRDESIAEAGNQVQDPGRDFITPVQQMRVSTTQDPIAMNIHSTLSALRTQLSKAMDLKQDLAMRRAALQREEEVADNRIASLVAQISTLLGVMDSSK